MKKWLFLCLLLLVGYQVYDVTTARDLGIHTGQVVLINEDTKWQGSPAKLVELPAFANVEMDGTYLLEREAVKALQKMFASADPSLSFVINSAYRDRDKQAQLYEELGEALALPAGYSEHESGLALDIGSTTADMYEAAEGQWLATYAADFGFVLRYPADKTDITGISYEPWHFRYVGLPHSRIMQNENLVLEEYIAKLQSGQTFQLDGYTVSYAEKVPERYVSLSGDNVGGYIVVK